MREEDYRRVVSKLAPDEDMKNRLLRKVVRKAPAKRKKVAVLAVAAACVIAVATALPLLLNTDTDGTETAVNTSNSAPAAQISEAAAKLRVVYGSGDYSVIYDALIAMRPEIASGGGYGADDGLSVQELEDKKRELEYNYTNRESVTVTDETGNYVYSAANRTVNILDEDGNVISWTECGSDRSFLITSEGEEEIGVYEYYKELFLQTGRLYALKSVVRVIRADGPVDEGQVPSFNQFYTLLEVYDVSAPEEIRLVKEIAVSGYYYGVLRKDESIDIFTDYYHYEIDKFRPETFIPMCYTENTMRVFAAEDIYQTEKYDGAHIPEVSDSYFAGVSVNTGKLEPQSYIALNKESSYAAFFGNGAAYFFYCRYTFEYDEAIRARFSYTEILMISDADGELQFAGQARVRGAHTYMNAQTIYGCGEDTVFYEGGRLYILTRVQTYGYGKSEEANIVRAHDMNGSQYPNWFTLYALDDDLKVVAMVDRIGCVSGLTLEYVDARLEGSKLYIVAKETGDNREPIPRLFILDVSDPADPVLLDNSTLDDVDKTIEWVCETEEGQ